MILSVSLPFVIMLLLFLEYIVRFSSLSVDDINLGSIIRCINNSQDFLRPSALSRKCSHVPYHVSVAYCVLLFITYLVIDKCLHLPLLYSTSLPSKGYAIFFILQSAGVLLHIFDSKSLIITCLVLLLDFFIDSGIWLINQSYHWNQIVFNIGLVFAISIFS